MTSIEDWAAKAARQIREKVVDNGIDRVSGVEIAAIIATCAEPLVALLRESKQYETTHKLGCAHYTWNPCTCGADAWNVRVEAVLGSPYTG